MLNNVPGVFLWGTFFYHGVQKMKFYQFKFLLNLMVHACLLYRSFGAWPKIAKQQLFSLAPIQSIKVKQFNMHISIFASLDALTCDQRKISITCTRGGGGGGGAKKSVWTPSSNTVELEERITNLLLK